MRLKFYGRNAHTVYWPGTYAVGQPRQYFGSRLVAGTGPKDPSRKVVTKEPDECDSDAHPAAAEHFKKQCQRGALWAADKQTADFCGVDFVRVELDADGDWSPAAAARPATPKTKEAS